MNEDERLLTHLLRAARKAPREAPANMPFPLAARILAEWRSAAWEDESFVLVWMCRRAVIFASVVMVASIGWSHFSRAGAVPGEAVFASLAKDVQIVP